MTLIRWVAQFVATFVLAAGCVGFTLWVIGVTTRWVHEQTCDNTSCDQWWRHGAAGHPKRDNK